MTLRDQRFTLAAATLGSFVALLDSTVVGIALPAISGDLRFGERRLFVVGAAGFAIASGAAPSPRRSRR